MLDRINLAIVWELAKNSRTTYSKISRRVGLTEGAVRRRVAQLVEERAVRLTALIQPKALGLTHHFYIGIKSDPRKIMRVGNHLAELPSVVYVSFVVGKYDLFVDALFATEQEYFEFISNDVSKIDGIVECEVFKVIKVTKTVNIWQESLLDAQLDEFPNGKGDE